MNKARLEAMSLNILDRAADGELVEDSFVELKREWLSDHQKAARRLCGHCNAAMGEHVLWLIGKSQDGSKATGKAEEAKEWMDQVNKHVDGIPPRLLQDLRLEHRGDPVAALLFDATRRPYVCKIAEAKAATLEVPWREATGVRSARREDLIRMMYPMIAVPRFDLVEGSVAKRIMSTGNDTSHWSGLITLYIVPDGRASFSLPSHKMVCTLYDGARTWSMKLDICVHPFMTARPDPNVLGTEGGYSVFGPGRMVLSLSSGHDESPPEGSDQLECELRFQFAGEKSQFVCRVRMQRDDREPSVWKAISLIE